MVKWTDFEGDGHPAFSSAAKDAPTRRIQGEWAEAVVVEFDGKTWVQATDGEVVVYEWASGEVTDDQVRRHFNLDG